MSLEESNKTSKKTPSVDSLYDEMLDQQGQEGNPFAEMLWENEKRKSLNKNKTITNQLTLLGFHVINNSVAEATIRSTRKSCKQVTERSVHPMIPILIATSITCADVSEMVDRTKVNNSVDSQTKQEIVEIYQIDFTKALGLECNWDAND